MNLQEIKQAVIEGKTVHWSNELYKVIKCKSSSKDVKAINDTYELVTVKEEDEFQIVCQNGHCIGLTWRDGTTLNGEEKDFYISEKHKNILS